MTMSDNTLRRLEARGLDVELAARMGFDSAQRVVGDPKVSVDTLAIPFKRNGEVVRRKYKLWERVPGAGMYLQDKGGVRCCWNEDVLRDPRLHGQPWILTEGELDAFAAIECGYERASSVPDGAPETPVGENNPDLWDTKAYAWVRDIKALVGIENVPEIILATDGDAAGAALLQDLSVLFGRSRCKYLVYPKAPPAAREQLGRDRCKDLNEVKQFYGVKGVVETIARAEFLKVKGVYRMSELPPVAERPIYDIGFPLFGENFKLRLGDFSVWTGIPGHGKSTLVTDIFGRVAYNHGLRIAIASFEQEPQTDHRRYLRAWYIGHRRMHADRDDVFAASHDNAPWSREEIEAADRFIDDHYRFIVPSEDEEVTLQWFLEAAEGAVVQHGCRVIIGDPWNEMDHEYDARAMTEAQYINSAIKTVRRFGRAFGAHMAIVAHPVKLPRMANGKRPMPALYDINGGAVWNNKADLGVVVYREDEQRTCVKTGKSRYHDKIGKPGSVVMGFNSNTRHFTEIARGAEESAGAEAAET